MGHRANYAIRRAGTVELYYSHWGALTVPADFFWGPEHAEEFIRTHRECDPEEDWLDDVWGEGGVALDCDERVITLFGGEALGHRPLRETFLELMAALWGASKWDVVWADAGMPAIAAAVGVDPVVATSEPMPPFAVDLGRLGESFDTDDPVFGCLLTVKSDGELVHRIGDSGVVGTLYAGPLLLDVLDQCPRLEDVVDVYEVPDYRGEEWGLGDELSHSAIVDTDTCQLLYRDAFAEKASTEFLREKWSDWEVARFEGTLHTHFERLAVPIPADLTPLHEELSDPSEVELTEEAALAEIAKYLIDAERDDPAAFVRRMQAEADERGEEVWVNPDALESSSVELGCEERQAIFGRAIALMKFIPR